MVSQKFTTSEGNFFPIASNELQMISSHRFPQHMRLRASENVPAGMRYYRWPLALKPQPIKLTIDIIPKINELRRPPLSDQPTRAIG
jgi:hypothetical protein